MQGLRRVLVLYVDRDNDIGERLRVDTPIIGRDNVLRAGIQFMLRCPDDSDGNAIFASVKTYDEMLETLGPGNVEVAIVAGSSRGGAEANLKVLGELNDVLSRFDADGIVVVSDGPSDEEVVPLIRERRPILYVERVIVKQEKSVEATASLIKYYFTKLVREPEYKRYFVGIPSVLMLLWSTFAAIGQLVDPRIIGAIWNGTLFAIGLLLLLYSVDLHVPFFSMLKRYEFTFFSVFVSTILIVSTINIAISETGENPIPLITTYVALPFMVNFIEGAVRNRTLRLYMFSIALLFVLLGNYLGDYLYRQSLTAEFLARLVIFATVSIITLLLSIFANKYIYDFINKVRQEI